MRLPVPIVTLAALALVPLAAGATQSVAAGPSATTDPATTVTATSAKINGRSTLTCAGSRGFKLAYPDHTANLTGAAGAGTSAFSLTVNGLAPGTAYAYTAFATDCAGTATGNPVTFTTLARVNFTLTGSGTVTGGIACAASCTADVTNGHRLSVTATPNAGSKFVGWGGICAGQPQTCAVVPSGTANLSVTFAAVHTLTVTKAGDGTGTVTTPAGEIACGTTCMASFTSGAGVTLTATAASDSVLTGWSGSCTGTAVTCTVGLGRDQAVTVTFTKEKKLSVAVHGRGKVTSSPGGLACADACSALVLPGIAVVLSAMPEPGWRFAGWSGSCTGASACSLTMTADATVAAEFSPVFVLRVIGVGGHGVVRSAPNGILCGQFCAKAFVQGAVVRLRATAAAGYRFTGWAGDCHGRKPCTVRMSRARGVVAVYAKR